MKTLIGGVIVASLGLIFLIIFRHSFFDLLKGTIPALLLLGGGLALYLGFDELQDTWKREDGAEASSQLKKDDKDKEIEELRKEIETLKKS